MKCRSRVPLRPSCIYRVCPVFIAPSSRMTRTLSGDAHELFRLKCDDCGCYPRHSKNTGRRVFIASVLYLPCLSRIGFILYLSCPSCNYRVRPIFVASFLCFSRPSYTYHIRPVLILSILYLLPSSVYSISCFYFIEFSI